MHLNIHFLLNDPAYAEVLRDVLEPEMGTCTIHASDTELLAQLSDLNIDILISSYTQPNFDAQTLRQLITSKLPDLPVIFVSKTRDAETITEVLKNPNTEVMIKPVSIEELKARILKLCDETSSVQVEDEILEFKNITIDNATKQVWVKNKLIKLSPTEFKLLEFLISNKNKVLSREAILDKVWGESTYVTDRIVDVYIGYLRNKIDNKDNPKIIITSPGFGYLLKDD